MKLHLALQLVWLRFPDNSDSRVIAPGLPDMESVVDAELLIGSCWAFF